MQIDISKKSKVQVLCALYNAAKFQIPYFYSNVKEMTEEMAEKIIEEKGYDYDYLYGRLMKINIEGDIIETWLYDRNNGEGAAQAAISKLPDIR